VIEVMIHGDPKAQKRHRHVNRGGFVTVYDPSKKDKEELRRACLEDSPIEPFEGAVSLEVQFAFKRPKSHYGTGKNATIVKASSPQYHTKKPDTDNCIKYLMDALNGLYWKDDSIIDEVVATKTWAIDEPYTRMVVVAEDEEGE
jgi:Holliday junction resolvase RusA-like endonuclease